MLVVRQERKKAVAKRGIGTNHPVFDNADVLATILAHYRQDRRGNVAVPCLLAECTKWRLVCKRFRLASCTTPTPYDAQVRFSAANPRHFPFEFREGGVAFGVDRHAWLVRVPATGRVLFVTTTQLGSWHVVSKSWSLRGVMRALGGHNVDFNYRLADLGSVIAGDRVTLMAGLVVQYGPAEDNTMVTARGTRVCLTTYETQYGDLKTSRDDTVHFAVERERKGNGRYVYYKTPTIAFCEAMRGWHDRLRVSPIATVGSKKVAGNVLPFAFRRAKRDRCIHPLTIALGYYCDPEVAECDGWLTSLWRIPADAHEEAKEMLADAPDQRENVLEWMAEVALKEVKRRQKQATAIVLHAKPRKYHFYRPEIRPKRKAAAEASPLIQSQMTTLGMVPRRVVEEDDDDGASVSSASSSFSGGSDDEDFGESSNAETSESGSDEEDPSDSDSEDAEVKELKQTAGVDPADTSDSDSDSDSENDDGRVEVEGDYDEDLFDEDI